MSPLGLSSDPFENKELPFAFAKRHGVLLHGIEKGCALIYHLPSPRLRIINELRRFLGMPLHLHEVTKDNFDDLLTRRYENQSDSSSRMMEGLDELDLFQVARQLAEEPEDLLESADDAPIIRLINALLAEAVKENASDIHIEPFENRLSVRFRVDGVLRETVQPKRALAPLLVSRIKVMAQLDIAEKRLPQDGRISLRIAGRAVDVRVSTIPGGQGERVVLRLLDKQAGRLDLEHLGMPAETLQRLYKHLHKPHGIIPVTGPTGSGKTTTLYAMLNHLNDRSRNIMTVEDPIEYYLDGIGQTQVNTKVDMTFAKGLRAILRQDPDVVMIGEIRDRETAQIAIQASLTGHLVLSTLHTNTAIGALTRLRDMGIEPFLLSSTLLAVMAQRLVRLLCPNCRKPRPHTQAETKLFQAAHLPVPEELYQACGCEHCIQTGYRGRTGVYELVDVDSVLRKMIHESAGQHEMEEYNGKNTPGLYASGLRCAATGKTSLEEIIRVSQSS